jgi:hypothetical protein
MHIGKMLESVYYLLSVPMPTSSSTLRRFAGDPSYPTAAYERSPYSFETFDTAGEEDGSGENVSCVCLDLRFERRVLAIF